MPVLSVARARLAFGHLPLLDGADFALDAREHVGLIGRNGSGKSSLLCVLAGLTDLDDGDRWVAPTVRIAFVAQEPSLDPAHTVYEAVAIGLGAEGRVLGEYHEALAALEHAAEDTRSHARVNALQARLDSTGWALGHRIENVISRLGLDADARVSTLSGGWKKRVALAQVLAAEPDVLLLDEPTNHLDIAAITWLEEFVRSYPGAVVCVTHDRRFLDAMATRIVELDRGRLRSYPGNFARYQERKAAELNEETLSNARFDKLLAQEETWIRKGIEARRTRNEGRVLRLAELRRERAARRDRLGRINLQVDDAERSGRMVAELSHVTKGFDDCVLIRDFTTRILRGDRIGLIGRNGAGKSTLLKLILGEVDADSGSVRRGTHLDVAYFDQLREQLDPEATLVETISPGGDFIALAGVKRHVMSYLSDFLFPPERARSPVKSLSGGERNRLLLARLFAQPANVLVLDEPTNDLDIETLELLEALLQEYTGTLFLVSHDRAFLDNVVTQTIAFEGDGLLREFAGGYSDWEAWHARQQEAAPSTIPANTNVKPSTAVRNTVGAQPRTGLSYREQQELAALPQEIEAIEQAITALRARFADPALYREHTGEVSALQGELERRELALTAAYAQWEALEARHASDRN